MGKVVKIRFQLAQHSIDEQLMKGLIDLFGSGHVTKSNNAFYYRVDKFIDIKDKIIPFFFLIFNSRSKISRF